MYIITNSVLGGEYKPSKANTLEEAQKWMMECTANNIRSYMCGRENFENYSDEQIIDWARNYIEGFKFYAMGSFLPYADDSYNLMNIYNLDKI